MNHSRGDYTTNCRRGRSLLAGWTSDAARREGDAAGTETMTGCSAWARLNCDRI